MEGQIDGPYFTGPFGWVWGSNKRGLELVTMLQGQKKSFISYALSEQLWWCNIKRFLSYSKNYICIFMQANSWHKLFHFHLPFWIWKVWKRKKLQKFEYLEKEKSFLDEIKTFFIVFKGLLLLGEKKKNKKQQTQALSNCNWPNGLTKWLSVHLQTNWFWVRVQLQSLNLQILCFLWARSSLTFRQL